MEVLVAVGVLLVEDGVAVGSPRVGADASLLVVGDDFPVLRLHWLHPDLEHVFAVRGEPGELLAVRRYPGKGPLRVAEENLPRDERLQVGPARGRSERG